jgi:hypothetical protein
LGYFVYKLIPPRPTLIADMTPAEGAVMREHGAIKAEAGFHVEVHPMPRAIVRPATLP